MKDWLSPITVSALILFGTGCANRVIHRNLTENPDALSRSWTLETHSIFGESGDRGYEFSNPVLHENTLIFGSRGQGVVSIYPKMGLTRWRLPIEGGVESEISVHDNSVYFGGADGQFYSVNAETGRIRWKTELRNPHVSKASFFGNRIFLTTSDDVVYAFDAGTGKRLWHYRRRGGQIASVRTASTPLVIGNQVIAGMSDGFLVALGLDDGAVQWERKLQTGTKFVDVDATAVLDQDRLYVPAYDGSLFCMKRSDGTILWKYDAGGPRQVVIDEQRVILPSSNGTVIALDKISGKELWKFELDAGIPTEVVGTDRYWVFGSSREYFYAIDKTTGEPAYRFSAGWGSGFLSAPAIDMTNRRAYALSQRGHIYAFRLSKPSTRRK